VASTRIEQKGESADISVVYFSVPKILEDARIQQIGEELSEATAEAVNGKLVLNFDNVKFMSSAMIGKIILVSKKCKAANVDLKLCNISNDVMEVFKLMRLNKILNIYKTEEKAIASYSKSGWFG